MSLPIMAWIFILVLALAPVLVGITDTLLTDWSKVNNLLGNLAPPMNPWPDIISFSMVFAIVLGLTGWVIVFIQTQKQFQALPSLMQITIIGILTLLTIGILWFELNWIFLTNFFKFYGGPIIGLPIIPNWIITIGWIWTVGIILFVMFRFGKQFRAR
jgi:hypothetical protein